MPRMTKFGLELPLWDFSAAAGNLLERAVGEVGIDYVVIPAVTGELTSFRPHWFPDAPTFHTEGGWHFPPTAKMYAASGVKPHRARWTAQRDMLRPVLDAAAAAKLAVFLSLNVQRHATWMDAEPHLLECTAWGQLKYPGSPCLLNPPVRELLRATLRDLQRFGPAGYVLQNLVMDDVRGHGCIDPGVSYTCFCAACRGAAEEGGIDAEAAARSVRVICAQAFASAAQAIDAVRREPLLNAYRAHRLRAALGWVERLRDEFAEQMLLFNDEVLDGADDGGPGIHRRVINQPQFERDAAPPAGRGPTRYSVPTRLWGWPESQPRLVRVYSDAVAAGLDYIDAADISELPTEFIDRWRQAVRYARRESGA